MILVDTSVWIDHLHRAEPALVDLLDADDVLSHPMVAGELALGTLPHRRDVLALLRHSPGAVRASDHEALALIEAQRLSGRGLSLVDLHLLAAARVTPETLLWTRDKRLRVAAAGLGVAWEPPRR